MVCAAVFDPMSMATDTATLPRGSVTACQIGPQQFLAACSPRCILPLLTWRSVVPGNAWTRFVPSSETLVARQGAQPTAASASFTSSTTVILGNPPTIGMDVSLHKYADVFSRHLSNPGSRCNSEERF